MYLTPDLELCREPAVLPDVIEINVIKEVPFNALLLLLIVHPPKKEAAVVGSSSHGKAGPGSGFHSRGAETTPRPPVWNGENKWEHQQSRILVGLCIPRPPRIPARNSMTCFGRSHGIFRAFWGKEPLERCLHLYWRVEFRQDLVRCSLQAPKNVPQLSHGALPPSISSLHLFCHPAALPYPPKKKNLIPKSPNQALQKGSAAGQDSCSIPLLSSNSFHSDFRANP